MHRLVHPTPLQAKGPAEGIPMAEEVRATKHREVTFRI